MLSLTGGCQFPPSMRILCTPLLLFDTKIPIQKQGVGVDLFADSENAGKSI
jgi:hypothetical protein